jgi:hypothetical protein
MEDGKRGALKESHEVLCLVQDLMRIDRCMKVCCSALFLFGRRRINKSVSILEKFVHNHADLCR